MNDNFLFVSPNSSSLFALFPDNLSSVLRFLSTSRTILGSDDYMPDSLTGFSGLIRFSGLIGLIRSYAHNKTLCN